LWPAILHHASALGSFSSIWNLPGVFTTNMTRRFVRAGVQLAVFAVCILVFVVTLDNRFRVLPNAIHGHLPSHYSGLVVTDVTIKSCSHINPFSKCNPISKSWTQVDKDLYLRTGWTSTAFVQFERKKEEDLLPTDKVVIDLKISRLVPETTENTKDGEKDEATWEPRPGGIWLRRTAKRHASDSQTAITLVDVLFGADAVDPRIGWEVRDTPLLLDSRTEDLEARISIQRGDPQKMKKPVPRINEHGRFKIMQLADLHLSTGLGSCRDPIPAEPVPGQKCEADPRTLEFVERLLDEEKPDMVVLTGDQVNGETSKDAQSALFKSVKLLVDRKIPYAAIFGNHDDEGNLNRSELMAMLEQLPYSLSSAGPEDIDGVGNYIVEVLGRGTSAHSALTLYLLDSHSYSPDERQFRGYDWIKPSQIRWFKNTAQGLKRKHHEYAYMHMNMAFIHIPLPEYRDPNNLFIGNWDEPPTAPGFNSGFKDALEEEGILFVSCGHDHVNDYCMLNNNKDEKPSLWMCYGGGVGFGGYGGYKDYVRRVRFFDFDMNAGRVMTYKRLEYGETEAKIDEQMIVDGGAVRGL
ncbi:phosphoesterase, partial [Aspergillus nomiae NRRL 13137]